MYRNAPKADILIPLGTKAFIPGQLYQTGEVVVSHGYGYFSECSSEQAETIADRRIHLANELLQKYKRERSLYSDKLEVPLMNEAFALENNGQEIIEAYDEDVEKCWREEHRRLVRENKQREREAKELAAKRATSEEISDEKLFAQLDEMELLEELENEMDQLELPTGENDDDQLGRLMRGEIQLKERTRISYKQTESFPEPGSVMHVPSAKVSTADIQQQIKSDGPKFKAEELEEQIETTDDEEHEQDDDEDDITKEFSQLLDDTKNYTTKEKIRTFHAKLKVVRQRLYENSLDIVQKVDLYQLHDELEEALEFLLPLNDSVDEQPVTKWETVKQQDADKGKQITFIEHVEEQKEPKSETIKIHDIDTGRKVKFADQEQIKLITNRHLGEQALLNDPKNTLFLPVNHTEFTSYYKSDSIDEIVSPADIYRKFLADEVFFKQSQFSDLKSILKHCKTNQTCPEHSVKQYPRTNGASEIQKLDLLGEIVEHTTIGSVTQDANVQFTQRSEQKRKMSRFKQQRN
uniref:Uncharacterized protein n=1 Tax=Anopheles maculatus TaxID=74869 RepID=A0A182STY7_9DIPT